MKDTTHKLEELSDLLLSLSSLLADSDISSSVHYSIALIINKVATILEIVCYENQQISVKLKEYQKLFNDLTYYYNLLDTENQELKLFIDAIKNYPGFQC